MNEPEERPLCFYKLSQDEKTKLQLRLGDLLKFLGAPGDWGYGTELGDFTLAALHLKDSINRTCCPCELSFFSSETEAWAAWNKRTSHEPSEWRAPDDAPELTEADFARATYRIGGRKVSREEWLEAARVAVKSE